MANSNEGWGNEGLEQVGDRSDGGARRLPPIIDVEAVELAGEPGASPSPADAAQVNSNRPRTPWGRLIAAGAVGAGLAIGASAAAWVYIAPVGDAGVDELRARIAGLEAQQRADAALLKSAASPAETAADRSLVDRIAKIEASLYPMANRVDDLDRGVHDNATALHTAGEHLAAVAGLVADLKKADTREIQQPQNQRSEPDGLTDRVAALGVELGSIEARLGKSTSGAPDKALRVAVVAVALRAVVERDRPFTAELAAARTLGVDSNVLAALEPFAAKGVPNPNELMRELSALVPQMLRVSTPAGPDGSYLDRLQVNATKLMNIRPVGDAQGDDPATVIGRIDLKMVRPDIAGVMAELDKLPAPAQELAQPWRAKAQAREAAINAARQLAAESLVKLAMQPDGDASTR